MTDELGENSENGESSENGEVDAVPEAAAEVNGDAVPVSQNVEVGEAVEADAVIVDTTDADGDPIDGDALDADGDQLIDIADEPGLPSAETIRALEAILMVSDQPVETGLLAQLLELSPTIIDDLCIQLADDYENGGRGFQLVRIAGGWRYQSHPDLAAYVERFALDGQVARLSGAALETLAIVAYKQPISRAQIAQIRGVNVDGVMRTLTQRGYVAEIGTDPGPGQATLFGTTKTFLESLGIDSVADLAPLADFVPGSEIMEALEAGLRIDTVEPIDPNPADGGGTVPAPDATAHDAAAHEDAAQEDAGAETAIDVSANPADA
jgi:segregation and condensation protein B